VTQSITETLANWSIAQRDQPLPAPLTRQTKLALIDYLGVTLGGLEIPAAAAIRSMAVAQGAAPQATLVGTGLKTSALLAALTNGTAGHALDMDDGHRMAAGHPGVTVIPAALAAAELSGATGAELLSAVAVGYEIFVRVASAMNPSHLDRGFHTTGTIGPLGAAAAAGLLLGLDGSRLTHALGAAASSAAGLFQVLHEGAMFKPVHAGRAAEAGLFAALWAREGGEAPRMALDGQDGMLKAYADGVDATQITENLGAPEAILGMYVKLHSACRHVHAAVDAGLELFQRRHVPVADVASIDVATYAVADRMTGHKGKVRDVPTARFSLQFCLALAALRGAAGPLEFVDDTLRDEALHDFARRISVREDRNLSNLFPRERGARLDVHLKDGREESITVMFPRGEPENPATDQEYHDKFRANAAATLNRTEADRIIDAVERIESTPTSAILAMTSGSGERTGLAPEPLR
jgi:2-methylcitrate dehydratase PrpD